MRDLLKAGVSGGKMAKHHKTAAGTTDSQQKHFRFMRLISVVIVAIVDLGQQKRKKDFNKSGNYSHQSNLYFTIN